MARNRIALSISLPPDLAETFDRLARARRKSRSAFMRDMLLEYQRNLEEQEFRRLQKYGARLARDAGILTEEDVERIVFEDR